MQFALINTTRSKPSPGLQAVCEACGAEMIAKCGSQRVHHWAHRGKRSCDPFWEPETVWHRSWKNMFPEPWQEVVRKDRETGEVHIADVHTALGLTLEFQHSHLGLAEQDARERAYRNMIWVVDGSRLVRDARRFGKNLGELRPLLTSWLFQTSFPEEHFPQSWLDRSVPVVFDFSVVAIAPGGTNFAKWLWTLLPGRVRGSALVIRQSKDWLVAQSQGCAEPIPATKIREQVERHYDEIDALQPRQMPAWRLQRRGRTARF